MKQGAIYEIRNGDVGKSTLRDWHGEIVHLVSVCGPVQRRDVGKRLFRRGDVVQIESQEQLEERLFESLS